MMKDVKSSTKLNNKGFTLIEVIIAMTVLVIVSVPMLDTLSGSTTMTRKSSHRQRATMLAQSISEGVKRYSTKELCEAFARAGAIKTADELNKFPILNHNNYNFTDFNRLRRKADGSYEKVVNTERNAVQENAREYYYEICNIETGVDTYDALITLDSGIYNDLNGEVIPEIVNIGAPGTALVDITGVFNGEDIIENIKKEVENDENPDHETFDSQKLRVNVEIVIKKVLVPVATGNENAYQVYGNVKYIYKYSNGHVGNFEKKYVGNRTLDEEQKLNYVYVILGDEKIFDVDGVKNNIRFNIDVDSSENIPIAVVTGDNEHVTWNMSVTSPVVTPGVDNNVWRDAVTFFTNAKDGKINFRDRDLANRVNDYGSSGNKLKRIYELRVELYHHRNGMTGKYQGDPIDTITSSYLRIDVDEFNDESSRGE